MKFITKGKDAKSDACIQRCSCLSDEYVESDGQCLMKVGIFLILLLYFLNSSLIFKQHI